MYDVYVDDRLLRFLPVKEQRGGADLLIQLKGSEDAKVLKEIYSSFEKNAFTNPLFIQSEDIDRTWKTFRQQFTLLEAAGGLVQDDQQRYLMIYRNGKWDLPKGKIEKGEDSESAARREISEECGIHHLQLVKQLITTYHTYPFGYKKVLKRTYWYLYTYHGNETPVPQLEEGILEVKWMNLKELNEAMTDSYASIATVIRPFLISENNDEAEERFR